MVSVVVALKCTGSTAPLPLAFTEVMAETSTNLWPGFRGSDYIEITNFGNNDLDLDGFGFSDSNREAVRRNPFAGLRIPAGTSVVFFRTNNSPDRPFMRTPADFIQWWGPENLPTNLQLRPYLNPAINGSAGDQLWLVDGANQVVDMVAFGASSRGRSFDYDPENGTLGIPCVAGQRQAFRAAAATNDIGSPGFNVGPVPLQISQQPSNQVSDICGNAAFSVVGQGLPRPRAYQWFHNGVPIPGANSSSLFLTNLQSSQSGEYRVELHNGLMAVTSAPALLMVHTNPRAPGITQWPADATVFRGQTAVFTVEVRGYPCLQFQWQANGVDLPGAIGASLTVPVPVDAAYGVVNYSVRVWNELGTATASAQLEVAPRPCLCITEIMPSPTNDVISRHFGWFELTNCGTNQVNLRGWRFRDAPSILDASVITNDLVMVPGESVVFVESMSAQEFKDWWGADNLPPRLQVVTWGGWGISAQGTDSLWLWNPAATDVDDAVATATYLAAIPGFSQECASFFDEAVGCASSYDRESVVWEKGAFPAAVGGDIGSPGYTANPPPRLLSVARDGPVVRVRCRVVAGKCYALQYKNSLSDPEWLPVGGGWTATGSILTLEDSDAGMAPSRFYRVEELP